MVSREKTELMIITGIARKSMDGTVKIVWYDWNIVRSSNRSSEEKYAIVGRAIKVIKVIAPINNKSIR